MKLGIPAETRPAETRVAATPETVKKLTASGHHTVFVQSGAGAGASIPDEHYTVAGATIVGTAAEIYSQAEIVLKVRGPDAQELAQMRSGQILIGLLNPH
ncbi:MAG: NAD(P)(+) transhydrogenase (Re/Si-specific) subunit alpha, partial [Burkholderiales bacterium]|nr:NAD(P)(+) transhydrogenase (Re/Si-specific) subunit alpha [Burkholderiales bacterium]